MMHPGIPIKLLHEIRQIAHGLDINRVALVGGAVRDELIYRLNNKEIFPLKDIDLLIEGSAIKLAKRIEEDLARNRVSRIHIYESFNTVEMTIDGIMVDLASSRDEKYIRPGENPKIEPTGIEKDLRRRDFTMNAMAIDIASNQLLDLYQGEVSIKRKEIEFIHSKSVEEDPTRIIRAARYAARFNFKVSPNSSEQIKNTLISWPWLWNEGDSPNSAPAALSNRLKLEMKILFNDNYWKDAMKNLESWGALTLLDKEIQNDPNWEKRIKWALKLNIDPLLSLIVISKNVLNLAKRLKVNKKQEELLKERLEFENWLNTIIDKKSYSYWLPSDWCKQIEEYKWHPEVIALSISMEITHWEILYKWLNEWRHIQSPITAKELLNQGWEPGPKLGQEISKLRQIHINKIDKGKDI